MPKRIEMLIVGALGLGALAGLCACASVGPATVSRDRFDYGTAITESWKRQTLLNIVKLRYMDPPVFVDVGQIVSGYTLESVVSVGATLLDQDAFGSDSLNLGAGGRYTDRPTITYTPLTGNRFVAGLMTPFRPEAVFSAIESGMPADAILFVALASINGLKNQTASVAGATPGDPEFLRVLVLMRKLQTSGAMGARLREGAEGRPTTIMTFHVPGDGGEIEADAAELRRLLRLDPKAAEFRLVFGASATSDLEIAVLTRSMLRVMGVMAAEVEVPPEHVAEGRATPGWQAAPVSAERTPLIRIQSSAEAPADEYVAVAYRDHWFWIDDRDLKSKRVFAFLMMLFTMAETGEREAMPVITIPAQ